MKYIINENRRDEFVSNVLKKLNIKFDLLYWNDNGRDSITGSVFLYKDGNIFGYRHGYEFFYDYDGRFKSLTYKGHYPKLENLDYFQGIPQEIVVDFFSNKMHAYLQDFISRGNSNLPI